MKVKILRSTVADKQSVKAGGVYDLSDKDAKYLILTKKAELVSGDEPTNDEAEPAEKVVEKRSHAGPKTKRSN